MTTSTSLFCSEISKSFGHCLVIAGISLQIDQGGCYSLLGPNGSGKTTLLKIFATLSKPTSGRFEIMGFDGDKDRIKARKELFIVAHGSHLYDEMSVEENIKFSMGIRGHSPLVSQVKSALDYTGIGPFFRIKCRYLSAGMKKRVALAKAILSQPRVLLLDEAYSSLDENGVSMVNHCIKDFKKNGATVFMTTHDRVRAFDVASRAGVLCSGHLKEIQTEDLIKDHAIF